jgi:hypothetical protein
MTNDSFQPGHFNNLAQKLENNGEIFTRDCNCQYQECITRTIIDRAYYAAFLHAREWLKTNDPNCNFIGDGRDHAIVRTCLERKRMKALSDILYELHKKRKKANYKTGISINKPYAKDVISMAENVINYLQ